MFAHEQQIFGLRTSRHQHRHGVGLGKSAQIVKMAVLPVGILDIAVAMADGRRGQNGNGVFADHAHELAAAARELLAIHVRSRSVQPLLGGRVDLSAQGQKFLEDHLGPDPDEFDEFGIRLFVRLRPRPHHRR